MRKQFVRFGAAFASVSLVATLLSPAAFAETLEISGNGDHSTNTITVTDPSTCTVTQSNTTTVVTEAVVKADTGDVQANNNTGSGVTVQTGDATATLKVWVEGGSNTATNPCCCQQTCDGEQALGALISGNGTHSTNDITLTTPSTSTIGQTNATTVVTAAVVKAKTGKVKANGNTGGTVGVTTGNAKSKLKVKVIAPSNTLNP